MAEKITKQEAVRRALAALGNDAKPAQMQGWIRDKLGIEMSADHISVSKGIVLRKMGVTGSQRPKKKAPAKQAEPGSTPASKAAPLKSGGIPLEDILTVRDLVSRLGANPLHALIDAFAK